MQVEEWDKLTKERGNSGQCKGTFFAFYRTVKFRRCESRAEDGGFCSLCVEIRAAVGDDGKVSCKSLEEYNVVNKALFARDDIKDCLKTWDSTVASGEQKESEEIVEGLPVL